MSNFLFRPGERTISLTRAWAIYIFIAVAFMLMTDFFISIQAGEISVIIYIAGGVCLNRFVLRRIVVWHPIYNTVDNVFKGKLHMFAFWPVSYPILLIKLAVVKHL